jgi:glycine/D-amino acid oxidase-like deaminating enzyme
MNAQVILKRLVHAAKGGGVSFFKADLKRLVMTKMQSAWRVCAGGTNFDADWMVLACGPLLPHFLSRLQLGSNIQEYRTTKIEVLSVRESTPSAMVLSGEFGLRGPNVVPFFAGKGGFTVTLVAADVDADAGDESARQVAKEELVAQTNRYFPGLIPPSSGLSFHVCHKIGRSTGEKRHYIVDHLEDGLLFFYPGKFTTGRVAARAALSEMKASNPAVCTQPYSR